MNNPVIEREWTGVLRTRKAAALQILPAVVCSILVLLRWPSEDQVDLSGTQARQVFQLFGYGLLTTFILLVPAFPATSIVRERLRGTLALLLHTPMRPTSIYLGKLIGVLGFVCLPLLVSLPAAGACYAMGGISARDDILGLYGILFLIAFQYSALGLFISSTSRSIDSALRTTYGLVLVLAVVTLGPYQVLRGLPWGPVVTVAQWVRSMSPIPAVMEILGHADAGSQGLVNLKGEPFRYVVTSLVSTLLLMVLTIRRLRPTLFDQSRSQGIITDDLGLIYRLTRRLFYVVDPQRRAGSIGPFTNPVLVKEFRCRQFGRSHWLMRLVALCAILSLGLAALSATAALNWGPGVIAALLIALQGALIVLLTPSLASGLISTEIESGGWTLLQMTPLSSGRILRGKLLSVALTLLLILFATLPGYVALIVSTPTLLQQVAYVFVCLALTCLLALMLSAMVSSLFRRTATATVTAYGLLLVLSVGTLLFWVGRDAMFGHNLVEQVLMVNPLAAALSVMEVPGFVQYHLVPASWWVVGTISLVCLVVLQVQVWRLTRPS
jgi:ABC-type transport system involved in multi-copper enzyme maturation permease subunit